MQSLAKFFWGRFLPAHPSIGGIEGWGARQLRTAEHAGGFFGVRIDYGAANGGGGGAAQAGVVWKGHVLESTF